MIIDEIILKLAPPLLRIYSCVVQSSWCRFAIRGVRKIKTLKMIGYFFPLLHFNCCSQIIDVVNYISNLQALKVLLLYVLLFEQIINHGQ